jgi:hypothetical protein
MTTDLSYVLGIALGMATIACGAVMLVWLS